MNTEPLVSLCVPTYQRARYLESLLTLLAEHWPALGYSAEVFIADNASTDRTPEVVAAFAGQLPIRYQRHAENIGGFANVQHVLTHARGRYIVYLADDDSLLLDQVAAVIAKMEADPELAVVYAPWLLYDLVNDQVESQFYEVPQDLRIARGEHLQLLEHVLDHRIFPEVQIIRREVLEAAMPRINEQAFFAFVHATDYLKRGAVLIQQQPFYVAISKYFADEPEREQLGNEEAAHAWDRYRGGLDYLLAHAGKVDDAQRLWLQARIQRMIAERMSVAIRLRYQARMSPVDTHMLALRLRGMGQEALSPVPVSLLASEAALHFLLNDPVLTRGMRRVLAVGEFEPGIEAFMRREARLPLEFSVTMPAPDALRDTLVFTRDGSAEPARHDTGLNLRVLPERELMARFSR